MFAKLTELLEESSEIINFLHLLNCDRLIVGVILTLFKTGLDVFGQRTLEFGGTRLKQLRIIFI